jgi:hypothetical protein
MRLLLLLPGAVLALVGLALTATFSFIGPEFPQSLQGVLGWALLLLGLAAMKVGARVGD